MEPHHPTGSVPLVSGFPGAHGFAKPLDCGSDESIPGTSLLTLFRQHT